MHNCTASKPAVETYSLLIFSQKFFNCYQTNHVNLETINGFVNRVYSAIVHQRISFFNQPIINGMIALESCHKPQLALRSKRCSIGIEKSKNMRLPLQKISTISYLRRAILTMDKAESLELMSENENIYISNLMFLYNCM